MAATSGIQDHEDVIKVMMAGGDVAMICSDYYVMGLEESSDSWRFTEMDGRKRIRFDLPDER